MSKVKVSEAVCRTCLWGVTGGCEMYDEIGRPAKGEDCTNYDQADEDAQAAARRMADGNITVKDCIAWLHSQADHTVQPGTLTGNIVSRLFDTLHDYERLQLAERGLQRCYVWQSNNGEGDDADEPLAIIYVSDVPCEGETVFVCLDERDGNREYRVVHRIFGINVPHHSGCWNLYVEPKRHGFID